ncbi:MAG: hypothetical protein D8M58_05210 [Calditrichaeota bacterium]|nr:MAG: hypothetical protein DWQ03_21295 [Calditrichota bacterium]MBL1204773.1 hypothetical protein [Calditrichota bacterium]NOG44602.1 hypothetical protein [Calditrichota bacterium]
MKIIKTKTLPYKPVSCSFHDELESLAVRQTSVEIIHRVESGDQNCIKSKIKDIITKDGAEFLILENDIQIRLDLIISVDGKELVNYC